MVREDLITCLRNAVERGYSLEHAKKVLINSGYNERDVEEAFNFVSSGALPMSYSADFSTLNQDYTQGIYDSSTSSSNFYHGYSPKVKHSPWLVIILSSIGLSLVIILILLILNYQKVLDFLSNI